MPSPAPIRLLAVLALTLSVALSGCTGSVSTPPTTSAAVTPPPHPAPPTDLAVVDPSLVTGLTSQVHESLKRGQYTYLAYPSIPGARAWTRAIKREVAPKVARFRELPAAPGKRPTRSSRSTGT